MTKKIAIDAMGGDYAPLEIVKGVELARDRYPELEFLLFGTESAVKPLVQNWERLTLIPTTEVIEMGDEPVKAMRRKKDSSMVQAALAVKDGRADALFSAGNTGALLSSAIFLVGRIKGVDRPALATALPSFGFRRQCREQTSSSLPIWYFGQLLCLTCPWYCGSNCALVE